MDNSWKIVNVGGVYGLECPHCHHKLSLKEFIFGDRSVDETCPFCQEDVSVNSIDYDKVLELMERTPE